MGIQLVRNKNPVCFGIGDDSVGDMLEEILFGSALTDCGGKDFSCGYLKVGDEA
jgi:hypothetical protein